MPPLPEWTESGKIVAPVGRKLTLVSVLAGYGKTTLLSERAGRCDSMDGLLCI
jgi:hypothetical protein